MVAPWAGDAQARQALAAHANLVRAERTDNTVERAQPQTAVLRVGGGSRIVPRDLTTPDVRRKGALWAGNPEEDGVSDVLFFSRFPTEMTRQITANVPNEVVPGRAFPVFQDMGGKEDKITLDVLFYDAWLDAARYPAAAAAPRWFDMYVVRNDGTGMSRAPIPIYYQLGESPPIPVVIESVELVEAHFKPGPRGEDVPQRVHAKLVMHIYYTTKLASPFKPKTPPPPQPGKGRGPTKVCGSGPGMSLWLAMPRPAGAFVGVAAAAYNAIPNTLTGPTGFALSTAQRAEAAAVKRLSGVQVSAPKGRGYAKDESAEFYNKAVDATGAALSDAWEWVNQDAQRGSANTSPGWSKPLYEGMQSSQDAFERSRMSTVDGAVFVEDGVAPDAAVAPAVRAVLMNEDPGG